MKRDEHLSALLRELTRLAEARQAHVNEQTYCVYAEELMLFEFSDVRNALRSIAREPKGKFNTAFPDLGTLIEEVRKETRLRMSASRFVACGKCYGGFVYVDLHGIPCEVHDSPNRSMKPCVCKGEWLAGREGGGVH
jgi:hypothetical protein